MKAYNIYVPPPVLNKIWLHIDTFEKIYNKCLPIDFVMKDW